MTQFFVLQLTDWFRDEWYDAEFDTWIGMCKNDVVLDDMSYNRSDIDQEELGRKVKKLCASFFTTQINKNS